MNKLFLLLAVAFTLLITDKSYASPSPFLPEEEARFLKIEGTLPVSWAGDVTVTGGVSAIGAKKVLASMTAIADGKILIGGAAGAGVAQTLSGDITMTNAGVTSIGAGKVTEAMQAPMAAGLNAMRIAKFVYDCSGVAGQCTVAAHGLGVTLPAHALVSKAWFYTKTTLTSTSNDGTIAFMCKSANDLFSAADIDAGSGGQGVAGQIFTGVPTGAGITGMFQTDAPCEITATIAVDAITAGKIDGFVQYVIAE